MKKKGHIITNILQILLLLSAFIFSYFTKKKMGMARHVIFLNQKIESNYPVIIIKYIILFSIVLLSILALVMYLKNSKNRKISKLNIIATVILSLACILFIVIQSKESIRSYYFVGILILLTFIVQVIKSILIIVKDRKNENQFS